MTQPMIQPMICLLYTSKQANDTVEIFSLLSYTNVNVLPFTEDIPLEVIAFLDQTIEKLCFEQTEGKTFIHLKLKDEEEIILNNPDVYKRQKFF